MKYQRALFIETIRNLYKQAGMSPAQLQQAAEKGTSVPFEMIRACLNDELPEPVPVQVVCAFSEIFSCPLEAVLGGSVTANVSGKEPSVDREPKMTAEERELFDLYRQLKGVPLAQHTVLQVSRNLGDLIAAKTAKPE